MLFDREPSDGWRFTIAFLAEEPAVKENLLVQARGKNFGNVWKYMKTKIQEKNFFFPEIK